MSEVRRKKREERGASLGPRPQSRDKRLWIGIAAVIVIAYAGFWYYTNHRYDSFAKCLASAHAKMYGLYWCPHCAEQKEMFGRSFRYVPYVECAIKGSHELAPECQVAGVKLFPSWQFGANKPVEGVFPLQELSDKTGCPLP